MSFTSEQVLPPTSYKIGQLWTYAPLVSIPGLKAHLALLHTFAEMKNSVHNVEVPATSNIPKDKDKRWAWFIGCAVERCVNLEKLQKSYHVL